MIPVQEGYVLLCLFVVLLPKSLSSFCTPSSPCGDSMPPLLSQERHRLSRPNVTPGGSIPGTPYAEAGLHRLVKLARIVNSNLPSVLQIVCEDMTQ